MLAIAYQGTIDICSHKEHRNPSLLVVSQNIGIWTLTPASMRTTATIDGLR